MKCKKCGHLNKSNTYYCVKCGSSLESNAIRDYKQKAKNEPLTHQTYTKTQKFIIALVIIGILIVVLSAVTPPELELPSLGAPDNYTQNMPIEQTDQTVNKLNTTIKIQDIGAKIGEKVTVKAYVTDENGDSVKGGTASITIENTKYSGQVENGNVDIILPELSQNTYNAVVVYEGNDKYNPSETKTTIDVNKENTKLETETNEDNLMILLTTQHGEKIPDAAITIASNDTQKEEKTDSEGKINTKIDTSIGKHELKISYAGNEKYNGTETSIEVGEDKKDTKIDTQFDNEMLTIKLMDINGEKISDATLNVTINNMDSQEKTDSNGMVNLKLDEQTSTVKIKYDGDGRYNPTEKIVEIEKNKKDTKLETEFEDETVTIKLSDNENNTIGDATLDINLNNMDSQEKTDNNGIVRLKINESSKIKIKYAGDDNYNPTETTANAIIEDNADKEDTNITNTNSTDKNNDTINKNVSDDNNNIQNLTSDTDNNTEDITHNPSKIDTKIEVGNEDNKTVITLLADENKKLSLEEVQIIFDNGTRVEKRTDMEGRIILDINQDVNEMELVYDGNENYNPFKKKVVITH